MKAASATCNCSGRNTGKRIRMVTATSRFCELYQRWNRNWDVVLRHDHKAGEKTFVDWAGDTVPVHDRESGETTPASIFVAVLGASTYTFARAAFKHKLAIQYIKNVHTPTLIECRKRSSRAPRIVTIAPAPDLGFPFSGFPLD